MILRPKPSPRHYATLAGAPSTAPMATVPAWLRKAIPDAQSLAVQGIEDIAITAGAAIGILDAVIRRQERWSGAWRQRQALLAGAMTAKRAGRVEDEAALRDAALLTRPGDDVGPAGRMLLAWRRLATRPVEDLLTEKGLAAVLEEFGHRRDDELAGDLADELRQLSDTAGLAGVVSGAFSAAVRHGLGRSFGCWLADALLAQRLGWVEAIPLLGAEMASGSSLGRSRRSTSARMAASLDEEADSASLLLAAQAHAVLRAIDRSAELERRAERLLAAAPKLRAKAADAVVERLLCDDAIVASERIAGMSDRGLRRLFDRLVELGAVRELSGRSTFRIYGL
ncbi:DUF1403 family protein [Mesorhizobium sp. WSM3224]|uniref:DUF1403 family protein n=1 Tax=Mesorhizobium sp. WSM3224 TaxID=1040986 RepID=UPI000404682E|nr:DUF1403 family protein [Mesorhizobium sp. WSM3224]